MVSVIAECSKYKPNLAPLLPVNALDPKYCARKNQHIEPSPCQPSREENEAFDSPNNIYLRNCRCMIPANRGGVRYRRAQPKVLDFDAADAQPYLV